MTSTSASGSSASCRREKAAAVRETRARQERRRRRLTIAGVTVGVLALIGGVTALTVYGGASSTPAATPPTATPDSASTSVPPWPAPAPEQVPSLVSAAGLSLAQMETLDVHYHSHLDISDEGRPVLVPGQIWIGASALSPLHTHDPTGIVHVEAPSAARFTLGQVFTEWNVRLGSNCVGGLCADAGHQLRFFGNGAIYTGDPTQLVLTPHEEIAIVYAPVGAHLAPPSSYPFPAGT